MQGVQNYPTLHYPLNPLIHSLVKVCPNKQFYPIAQ